MLGVFQLLMIAHNKQYKNKIMFPQDAHKTGLIPFLLISLKICF